MKNHIEIPNQSIREASDSEKIISSIEINFQEMAKNIILDTVDISNERNKKFLDNPDDPNEHKPNWHQWGIITHTEKVKEFYQKEVPKYLELWGIKEKIASSMSERIGGKSKNELFEIAIMFHDLGKFISREVKIENDIAVDFNFHGHEKASGEIIRGPQFSSKLKEEYGLSERQIEYIARCAELHYTLGKMRKQAKKSDIGYTVAFAQSVFFRREVVEIIDDYKEYALEIGLFFLADSLGKTDIRINASANKDSKSQYEAVRQTILRGKLNPKLIEAVKEVPISIAVAENYLKIWADQ